MYPDLESQSARLFHRASKVLPDSGSRSTIRMTPYTPYLKEANGKYLVDVDGNEFFDFNNNFTSLIHGHSHPKIIEAVHEQISKGTAHSFMTEAEIKLAELLCKRSPNFDKIRFMNSGTEAVMNAVKVARAFTGKPKIAKCENAYHGTFDTVQVSIGVKPTALDTGDPVPQPGSIGTPQEVIDQVIIIPLNEPEIALRILKNNAADLAAVLIDPFFFGSKLPTDEFLQMLKTFCQAHDVLLVLDEVMSFRASYSGSQGERNIPADLTALGKIIGGGFPVGAIAGRAEIMATLESGDDGSAPKLPHAGTFNANPITMVAGYAAMELMSESEFDRINALGEAFRQGISEAFELTNTLGMGDGHHSLFMIETEEPSLNSPYDRSQTHEIMGLNRYLMNHGYFMFRGLSGVVSTVMDTSDIDPFCQTLLNGIRALKH